MNGHDNPVFTSDDYTYKPTKSVKVKSNKINDGIFIGEDEKKVKIHETKERVVWSSDTEFLMSCIAYSVGLGNVWRFPFVALENGGGAFVIPYVILLIFIGKPSYLMEMAKGQFCSGNCIRVYNCVPVLKGVGLGQLIATIFVSTYYATIMATTFKYFTDSFHPTLPWSVCRPEWGPCIPARPIDGMNVTWSNETRSSAEHYYLNEVIRAKDNILDGIGGPIWNLFGYLVLSWVIIALVLLKGVKSSGKASYFLAIFPYVVLLTLLIRALTLPGSFNGIVFFFTPQWDKILQPGVWYAAITQMFFSLGIYFGTIVTYAGYNKFEHNVSRASHIVTTLDTFTSILSGCTVFGIIGHLAHELNVDDISLVVRGGPGLAFISYPEAISKFRNIPQLYGVLFFFMLFVLALGTMVCMTTCVTTLLQDTFKSIKNWHAVVGFTIFGILTGTVYITPGGQSILSLVDDYGATFVVFILAITQIGTYCYIYGVEKMCKNIEFMTGSYPNIFWRVCWWFITPAIMLVIVIYTLMYFELPTDGDYAFPFWAHAVGWSLSSVAFVQVPIFAFHRIRRRPGATVWKKIKLSFKPAERWGPRDEILFQKYKESLNR